MGKNRNALKATLLPGLHSSLLVTTLAPPGYEPFEGRFLVTSSFDEAVRIWFALDFKLVKTLTGHEGSVAGIAVSADGSWLGTVSHDRTFRLWFV